MDLSLGYSTKRCKFQNLHLSYMLMMPDVNSDDASAADYRTSRR